VGAGTTDVAVAATDPSGNVRTNTYRVTASGAGVTYTYDPNGNLTGKTEGTDTWTYSWNAENQLTKVEKNGAEQARFSYDPYGRRVEKVAGGVTSAFVYDGENILRESHGATTVKYVHAIGPDEPIASDDGAALSFFHADGLGSVVRLTTTAGAVTQSRQYDAWGNLEIGAGEAGYTFTGREWDPETGLYYYRARYYDPKAGRFLAEDPVREPPNSYSYVANNPIRFVDPSGLLKLSIKWRVEDLWPKGATWIDANRIDYECTQTSCGRWKLEFSVKATIVMHLDFRCPEWSSAHESRHARNFGRNIVASLGPLYEAESKTYASEHTCRGNAWLAAVEAGENLEKNHFAGNSHVTNFWPYIPCRWDPRAD